MESWFLFALLSAIFAGLFNFMLKISAEKNHNSSLVILYSYLSGLTISGIFLSFNLENLDSLLFIIFLAFINSLFYFFATLTRIESLKYIDTTIYFPLYKTFSPIFIALISYFIFTENLTRFEFIGIISGILVPLLLINQAENKKQKNMKKGLIYLLIGIIFVLITTSTGKIIMEKDLNLYIYIFFTPLFGLVFSYFTYKKTYNENHSSHKLKRIGILNGFFYFIMFYTFTLSMKGNLAIVYTINSFSLLIPILLSVFIYKEHFDKKKTLAIILTILSLYFFQ
ncbi:MAG: EamA family transporter [Nanoarchaeota archaeon]|nr:EamA family transporter [Nanoarchaeota archaeon]